MSDLTSGGVDLGSAGDDPISSTAANTLRKVNEKQQPKGMPKPGGKQQGQSPQKPKPPEPKVAGPNRLGDIPKVTGAEQQQGQKQTEQQWAQRPLKSSNPILNAFESVPDAGYIGYQGARYMMQGMKSFQTTQSGRATTSVQNLWEQNSAWAKIMQQALTAAAETPPGIGLQEAYYDMYGGQGNPTTPFHSTPEQQAQAMVGGLVSMAFDPNMYAMAAVPGGEAGEAGTAAEAGAETAGKVAPEIAGKAADVGAQEAPKAAEAGAQAGAQQAPVEAQQAAQQVQDVAQSARVSQAAAQVPGEAQTTAEQVAQQAKVQQIATALSKQSPQAIGNVGYNILNDPNPTPQSLAWDVGLGVIASNGMIPPGTRQLLKAMGPAWDRLGNTLSSEYARNLQRQIELDGGDRTKFFDELMGDLVDNGEMQPQHDVVARAPKEQVGEYTKDPETGELTLKGPAKKRLKALQKMGLESQADLLDHLESGDLSAQQIDQMQKQWKYLGLPYDLVHASEGELPLVNPANHLPDMGKDMQRKGESGVTALRMFVDHAHRGPYGNNESPLVALWRSMIGFNRTTDMLHQHMMGSWVRVLGDDADKVSVQKNLMRAAEGDMDVYDKLPANQKFVVDSWRVSIAAMRRVSQESGYAHNFTDYWVPRLRSIPEDERVRTGGGKGPDVLKGEKRAHRSVAAQLVPTDDTGNQEIQLTSKYKSVFDLNKDEAQWRANLAQDILDPDKAVKDVSADPALVKAIRAIKDPQVAQQEAEALAKQIRPDFETNFLAAANRSLGKQMAAIHAHQGATTLLHTVGKDGRMAAFDVKGKSGMLKDSLREQGYVQPESPYFKDMMVNGEFADLLNKGSRAANRWYLDKGILGSLLQIEQKAIAFIMYSPMIHGMNLAGRFGIAWTAHPMTMTRYLTRGGARDTLDRLGGIFSTDHYGEDGEDFYNKLEAYRAGVIPYSKWSRYGSEAYSAHADALGDQSIAEYPGIAHDDDVPASAKNSGMDIKGLAKPARSTWDFLNNILWKNVGDFGTMMYQIEKQSLLKSGFTDDVATRLAARRANSWMGHVAPEDTNPVLHDLARTIFFAPNWWRTWGELLTGVYKNAGFQWDQKTLTQSVANDLRVAIAAYGFQKMSGNVFNYAMSGHTQEQNLPGDQDKIEITNPEILRMLQGLGIAKDINPDTGENPTTGARLTIENPLARQQYALETAAGYESGQAGTPIANIGGMEISGPSSLPAAVQGTEKEIASRLSPLLNSAFAVANVDLYNSIASGQVKHLNPDESIGADDALMALFYLTPLGYKAAQGVEQGEGVYGTQTPPSVQAAAGGIGNSAIQTVLSSLTGVNPASEYGEKTAGTQLTDSQYQQIQQINNQYDQQMTTLQKELASNVISPDQWRTEYEQLTVQRAVILQAFYAKSPQYTQGTDGLVAQYEALYTNPQVQNADGSINEEALQQLQNQFAATHTSAQMNAVNSVLAKTQMKYPAVKAYKDAINSYYTFQNQWAQENGVNVYSLQKESQEYGQLYGTPNGTAFLGEHPDLMKWEVAKRQWLRTAQGYAYGIFEGSSTTIKEAEAQAIGGDAPGTTQRGTATNPNAAAQAALDTQIQQDLVNQLMQQGTPAADATAEANKLLGTAAP